MGVPGARPRTHESSKSLNGDGSIRAERVVEKKYILKMCVRGSVLDARRTNTTDQPRFYAAFLERFADVLPPGDARCPFGPNFGDNSYKYVCSLERGPPAPFSLPRAVDDETRCAGERKK